MFGYREVVNGWSSIWGECCRETRCRKATREGKAWHAAAEARPSNAASQVCSGIITPPIVRDPLLAGWLGSNVDGQHCRFGVLKQKCTACIESASVFCWSSNVGNMIMRCILREALDICVSDPLIQISSW